MISTEGNKEQERKQGGRKKQRRDGKKQGNVRKQEKPLMKERMQEGRK